MKSMDKDVPETARHHPSRARGYKRVAAILDAASELFQEKGYHGATMTEIAERSHTAIGSLYRFFPNKDHLVDALLTQFATNVTATLRDLASRAQSLSHEQVAKELVTFFATFDLQRGFATALVDARSGATERRSQFRNAVRNAMASLVEHVLPGLPQAKCKSMSMVLLYLLKGISTAERENPENRTQFVSELRKLIQAYFDNAKSELLEAAPRKKVKM